MPRRGNALCRCGLIWARNHVQSRHCRELHSVQRIRVILTVVHALYGTPSAGHERLRRCSPSAPVWKPEGPTGNAFAEKGTTALQPVSLNSDASLSANRGIHVWLFDLFLLCA